MGTERGCVPFLGDMIKAPWSGSHIFLLLFSSYRLKRSFDYTICRLPRPEGWDESGICSSIRSNYSAAASPVSPFPFSADHCMDINTSR